MMEITIPINIKDTFGKFVEDFDSIFRRISWCNELENTLLSFEDELEDPEAKYLSWFVSTLKDVFAYNYADQLTNEQLVVLKEGFKIIHEKGIRCSKKDYAEYHSKLLASGLCLLPTSLKAICKFR